MISATLKKLRFAPGMRVCVLDAPTGFETEVKDATEVTRAAKLGKDLELVIAFFTRGAHLERELVRLRSALGPKGILWIGYPKAKALETDLNRDVIRERAAKKKLEAVAIVAIDGVWSALRCKKLD